MVICFHSQFITERNQNFNAEQLILILYYLKIFLENIEFLSKLAVEIFWDIVFDKHGNSLSKKFE